MFMKWKSHMRMQMHDEEKIWIRDSIWIFKNDAMKCTIWRCSRSLVAFEASGKNWTFICSIRNEIQKWMISTENGCRFSNPSASCHYHNSFHVGKRKTKNATSVSDLQKATNKRATKWMRELKQQPTYSMPSMSWMECKNGLNL